MPCRCCEGEMGQKKTAKLRKEKNRSPRPTGAHHLATASMPQKEKGGKESQRRPHKLDESAEKTSSCHNPKGRGTNDGGPLL